MVDCKKCRNLIQKELDGKLSELEAARLREHIGVCDDCRRDWAGFAAVRDLLRADKPVEPPPDFVSRLASKLERTPKVGFVEGYVVPFFLQNRIRLAMASFILIVAGFGLLFSFYQQEKNFGSLISGADAYAEATIGIRSPGAPTFVIPASDEPIKDDENGDPSKEIEELLRTYYGESDMHLASD
jgi:hypothetical protein